MAVRLDNPKHLKDFTELVDRALAASASAVNVNQVVLEAKKAELGKSLALAIANGKDHSSLLEQYSEIHQATSLDAVLDRGLEVYENVDLRELMRQEVTDAVYLKLMPQSLNERLRGGLKKGNHVVAFGRPEAGKSCFSINAACGFARQGFKGLYFINEDRPEDIILRCIGNLSGEIIDENSSEQEIEHATTVAESNGFRNILVISVAPGTLDQIERMVEKYKPDWMVIDQLRNVQIKEDNRVVQLEKAATGVRTIAKKYNVVCISVTQAGDSASGKAVLDMSDIDSSKTGIPAQADVMIGIGVNDDLELGGRRMLSLPKNKRGGRHESFAVNIDTLLSRMTSV